MRNLDSVFRNEALQRYLKSRNEAVLPQFIRPKTFFFLWVFISLLIAICTVAWFAQLPLYVSGQGIVIDGDDGLELLVFVPSEDLALTKQDTVWITMLDGQREAQDIAMIEDDIQSPQSIYEQYTSYANSLSSMVTQPSWIIHTKFLGDQIYVGSQYPIQVEVGSQRIISHFPFVGHFFRSNS